MPLKKVGDAGHRSIRAGSVESQIPRQMEATDASSFHIRNMKEARRNHVIFYRLNKLLSAISLRHLVEGIFITTLVYQRLQLAILDPKKLTGLPELYDISGIEDHLHE